MIGNLLPGQKAVINIQIMKQLKIVGSAFDLTIPLYYMPRVRDHEIIRLDDNFISDKEMEDINPDYSFEYKFHLTSKNKITMVSGPDGAVAARPDGSYTISRDVSNVIPKREIRIFYKTENMLEPQLKYKVQGDEVACMFSVVPTFEQASNPQECVVSSEVPMSEQISKGNDFFFVFVVDCSGSMSGGRMRTTKAALTLFMQSMPPGSKFSII